MWGARGCSSTPAPASPHPAPPSPPPAWQRIATKFASSCSAHRRPAAALRSLSGTRASGTGRRPSPWCACQGRSRKHPADAKGGRPLSWLAARLSIARGSWCVGARVRTSELAGDGREQLRGPRAEDLVGRHVEEGDAAAPERHRLERLQVILRELDLPVWSDTGKNTHKTSTRAVCARRPPERITRSRRGRCVPCERPASSRARAPICSSAETGPAGRGIAQGRRWGCKRTECSSWAPFRPQSPRPRAFRCLARRPLSPYDD